MSAFVGSWPYSMCQETYDQCISNVTTATPTLNGSDTKNPAFDRCNLNRLCGNRNATDALLTGVRYATTESLKPRPKYTTGQIVGISFGAIIGAIVVLPVAWISLTLIFQFCSAGFKRVRGQATYKRRLRATRAHSVRQNTRSNAAPLVSPPAAASPSVRSQRTSSQLSSAPSYESYQLPSYHSTWTHSGPQDGVVQ